MDQNRAEGTVRNLGGKAEEKVGQFTGDAKLQTEGVINQAAGAAQDLYGQARDTASTLMESGKEKAVTFEKVMRDTIETQPYTAVAVALGLGWLLGRMHRPL